MQPEYNQEIFEPYPDPNPDPNPNPDPDPYPNPNIHPYNNTVVEESPGMVFIDTLFIFFCIFTVIPTVTRCLYIEYLKHNERQNTIQENPIDNLQTLIITNQPYVLPEDICTICLEEFKFDEELKKLKCNHIFHKDCLKPWLDNKKKCPICRADIV